MKKAVITMVTVAAVVMSGTAWAGNQRNTGCGLGTIIFEGADFGNTAMGQSFIVTTNMTSGNQTFGITSGTLNCKKTKFVKNERLNEFVVANMDNLAKDIAMGQGESLDTLAELMEVPSHSRPQLFAKLQTNFNDIYTSGAIDAAGVVDNIHSLIQ